MRKSGGVIQGLQGMRDRKLQGKRIFIAGGTGKVGRALLRSFKEEGVEVVFGYCHQESKAKALARELAMPEPVRLDLGDYKAIVSACEWALKTLGGLDGLVNVAGIWREAPLEQATLEDIETTLRVNLLGPLLLVKQVLGVLKSNPKGGSIVLFGSSHHDLEAPLSTFYAISKTGLVGLVRALAVELAPFGIRVNALAPRYVLSMERAKERLQKEAGLVPVSRSFSHPLDVAQVVKFFLSEDSGIVSGQTIELEVPFGYFG